MGRREVGLFSLPGGIALGPSPWGEPPSAWRHHQSQISPAYQHIFLTVLAASSHFREGAESCASNIRRPLYHLMKRGDHRKLSSAAKRTISVSWKRWTRAARKPVGKFTPTD